MNLNIPSPGLRHFRSCLLLAGILFCWTPADYPQSLPSPRYLPAATSQAVISVKTELVLLSVKVTDAHGTFVSGLSQQNFRVYEDGRLQKVAFFQQEDAPVSVGLVVDHSRSMGPKLPEVAAAVSDFARSSNPQDEMFVVDFNDDVSIEPLGGKPFTNDPNELEKAVAGVSAQGRTALYDAVSVGLHHLQLAHWARKALIVVSDGGDNASHQKYSQVLALARQSQVLIYSIVLVDPNQEQDANPGLLRRLCKETGGVAYFPGKGESVANASADIARDLRERYTLGYEPRNMNRAGTYRKIEVKVDAPGHGRLRVRTRRGYSPAAEKQTAAQPDSGKKR